MAKPRRAVAAEQTIVCIHGLVNYREKSRALISRADVQVQAPTITSSLARLHSPVCPWRASSLVVGGVNSRETALKQGGNNRAASGADHRPPPAPPHGRPADLIVATPAFFSPKKGMPL